jgi:hypothetical protein
MTLTKGIGRLGRHKHRCRESRAEYHASCSDLCTYEQVINDLLDPARQNLKIREDAQGTYVEGVKHEVVISPAHALSFIQIGEGTFFKGANISFWNFQVHTREHFSMPAISEFNESVNSSQDRVSKALLRWEQFGQQGTCRVVLGNVVAICLLICRCNL